MSYGADDGTYQLPHVKPNKTQYNWIFYNKIIHELIRFTMVFNIFSVFRDPANS